MSTGVLVVDVSRSRRPVPHPLCIHPPQATPGRYRSPERRRTHGSEISPTGHRVFNYRSPKACVERRNIGTEFPAAQGFLLHLTPCEYPCRAGDGYEGYADPSTARRGGSETVPLIDRLRRGQAMAPISLCGSRLVRILGRFRVTPRARRRCPTGSRAWRPRGENARPASGSPAGYAFARSAG